MYAGRMNTNNRSRGPFSRRWRWGRREPSHAQAPLRDTIGLDAEHQTIENFAASDCWSMQKLGRVLPNRNRAADLLFRRALESGFPAAVQRRGGVTDKINNPWRTAETFEVAEGKYDWTRQAPERWFLRRRRLAGSPVPAFVNSPPDA